MLLASTVETMLKDYTGDLPVSEEVMKEVVTTVEDSYSFAVGCWIYDRASDNTPSVYSSPGIHGFENWIDTEHKYLFVLFVRTDTDNEPDVTDLAEALRPDVLEFYQDETGTSYSSMLMFILGIMLML